ncbi:hypothetical protein RhiJN_19232 [Ceratobasidium sp. AG-Ba]|nr:hypothetical protein RhiJN_19232 [Ceratobasidium sp. AG-Ba]
MCYLTQLALHQRVELIIHPLFYRFHTEPLPLFLFRRRTGTLSQILDQHAYPPSLSAWSWRYGVRASQGHRLLAHGIVPEVLLRVLAGTLFAVTPRTPHSGSIYPLGSDAGPRVLARTRTV